METFYSGGWCENNFLELERGKFIINSSHGMYYIIKVMTERIFFCRDFPATVFPELTLLLIKVPVKPLISSCLTSNYIRSATVGTE